MSVVVTDAASGEVVENGSVSLGRTIAAEFGPHVFGDNPEDIGANRCGKRRANRRAEDEVGSETDKGS